MCNAWNSLNKFFVVITKIFFSWKMPYRKTILLLKLVGMWKYHPESIFYKIYRNIMTLSIFLTCIFCLIYTFENYKDPEAIFFISYLPAIFTVPVKYVMFPINLSQIQKLITVLDPKNALIRTREQRGFIENSKKLSEWIFKLYGGSFVAAAVGIVSTPLSTRTQVLRFIEWLPVDYSQNRNYYGVFCGLLFWVFHLIAVNAAGDLFFYISTIQMEGRFDLINHTFLNFEDISSQNGRLNEEKTNQKMHEILIECVKQYNVIIKWVYFFEKNNISEFQVLKNSDWMLQRNPDESVNLLVFVSDACNVPTKRGKNNFRRVNLLKKIKFQAEPLSLNFFRVIFYAIAMTSEIFLFCFFGNRIIVKVSSNSEKF